MFNKDKSYNSYLEDMEFKAYMFAKEKHNGQTRRDGSSYINHPIKVAELVKKYFNNHPKIKNYILAAYLHDVVEDTDTSINQISELFGEDIASLVFSLTNDDELKNKVGKTNYLCIKLYEMDEDSLNIKLCDRLANVLDLKNADLDFAQKYKIETNIIMSYLLENRILNCIQRNIIDEIIEQLNVMEIPILVKQINI